MCIVKRIEAMICLEFYHGLVHFAAHTETPYK
jgi:hypothetical protein